MKRSLFSLALTLIITFTSALAQQGEWTWMKGSSSNSGSPVFGTQGTPNAANTPPALYEGVEWTDLNGNFWLFGGLRDAGSEYNTLWKLDPTTNEWTWMKGSSNCCQAGSYGTQGISSPNNTPGARAWGACSWVDTDGNLWLYGGIGNDGIGSYEVLSDLWEYDISTNEWTWINGPSQATVPVDYGTLGIPAASNHPGARAESNAAWADNSNNFWMLGGALYFPLSGGGGWSIGGFGNDMWEFDMSTQLWTWMKGTTTLSGSGVFGTKGVPSNTNYPPGIGSYAKWKDANGDLWMFGGYNLGSSWNTMWRYNVTDNMWTWMSGSNVANNNGTTGTQCVPDANSSPSARYENRTFWTANDGNFWIFGGIRTNFNNDVQNDLWQYNSSTNEWTWVSGSLLANQSGSYGTIGVSSPTNVPPSKFGSVGWKDVDGNLWLFGGSDGFFSSKNDLWKYVPDPNCPFTPQVSFGSNATQLCEKFCTDFFDSSSNNATSWLWLFPGATPSSSTSQNPTNICYQVPGVYDVTLITTSTSGNDTLTLTDYMTVFTNPFAPVISQNGNVLTSSAATTYQWELNSVEIPGATSQDITISQSGLYTVKISDANGCIAQSSIDVTFIGIDDPNDDDAIAIYPNPSNGEFLVEWTNASASDEMKIEIYNILGQIIFSSVEEIHNHNFSKTISLKEMPAGIYFLKMNSGSHSMKKKLILAE